MVKNVLFLIFLLLAPLAGATEIRLKLATSPTKIYVASYYGAGVQVLDSLGMCDGEGVWELEGAVPEGIYFITDGPQGSRFEFLVGTDQDFEIELNRLDSHVACVTGAVESEAFRAYQTVVEDRYKSKNEKIAYTRSAYEKAPEGSLLRLVLGAMVPAPVQEESTSLLVVNNEAVYDYNALHYWDNYDLSDNRLVRTPFFAQRMNMFLNQVLPPRVDKIMNGMLPLLDRVEGANEVLKIVASAALNLAVENSIMGIDALGYEVITRYYLSGSFGELASKQRLMLEDYVRHTAYCRVGHKAQEMRLYPLELERGEVSLYETVSAYTLVLFWEPDCDYCKVLLPELEDKIMTKYRAEGLQIFAVNTQRDYQIWKDYIINHELFTWQHGYQATGVSDFMIDYGVQGTPFMYILDADKNIVAKNVKFEHLDRMMERLFASGSIY